MPKSGVGASSSSHSAEGLFPPLNYSRSYFTQWLLKDQSNPSPNAAAAATPFSSVAHKRQHMELIQLLAINALEFTAPVYSFLNKEEKEVKAKEALSKKTSTELKLEREFIQLSGHPGSFAPAGPTTLWKKMPMDSHQESLIYSQLKTTNDEITTLIPHFLSTTTYNQSEFIELEDLITRFNLSNLNVMDVKLGTRTFLESEVQNNKPRADLFEKMFKIDPTALTKEELEVKSVTKLRYMSFREKLSSSSELGFRIEGVKLTNQVLEVNFQTLRSEGEIKRVLRIFCGNFRDCFKAKLIEIRNKLESSEFFKFHELIGSSLLFIHDENIYGIWLIDFAKTYKSEKELDHRAKWEFGNRADGVLLGVDSLIRLI